MRKMKKFLALTLAAAMVIPAAPVSATEPIEWNNNGGETTIIGESGVVQPVLEVALPGDLAFTLDPSCIENKNSQIVGYDYNVINYSNVPVKVEVQPYIVDWGDESAINVLSAAPALKTIDTSVDVYADITSSSGNKDVYVIAIAADNVTQLADSDGDGMYEFAYTANATNLGRAANTFASDTLTIGTFAKGTSSVAPIVLESKEVDPVPTYNDSATTTNTFTFSLEKATFDDEGLLDKQNSAKSVSSFTLAGAVDSSQTYADGELAVQAVYKMTLLSQQMKETLDGASDANLESTKQRLTK